MLNEHVFGGGLRIFILLLAAQLAFPVGAQEVADNYTAEKMLELCKGTAPGLHPDQQSMVCTFRIQGVIAIAVENCWSIDLGYAPAPILAFEKPPSRGAARQAFKNYMEANPDKWGLPWAAAVSFALSDAFPCER